MVDVRLGHGEFGLSSITVTDNGHGYPNAEASTLFTRLGGSWKQRGGFTTGRPIRVSSTHDEKETGICSFASYLARQGDQCANGVRSDRNPEIACGVATPERHAVSPKEECGQQPMSHSPFDLHTADSKPIPPAQALSSRTASHLHGPPSRPHRPYKLRADLPGR